MNEWMGVIVPVGVMGLVVGLWWRKELAEERRYEREQEKIRAEIRRRWEEKRRREINEKWGVNSD